MNSLLATTHMRTTEVWIDPASVPVTPLVVWFVLAQISWLAPCVMIQPEVLPVAEATLKVSPTAAVAGKEKDVCAA